MLTTSLAIALAIVAQERAAATAVTGDWDVTVTSPMGANTTRTVFKQDGEKLSGIFKGRQGELPFDGGSVTGNDIKFAFSIPFQGASLETKLTGKIDGQSMSGKADF